MRKQIGIRVEEELLRRLDVCAAELSRRAAGMAVSRADAGRMALDRGVVELERELGITPEQKEGKKKPASKPR